MAKNHEKLIDKLIHFDMKNRIAVISEHASPLATLGGVDAGGQNVYVAELAKSLSLAGYDLDIFTRWEDPALPHVVKWMPGIRIIHLAAGPKEVIAKESLLPFMDEFRESMLTYIRRNKIVYDLIHANFWMSGLVASQLKEILGIPFVITFHALGHVRRIHQGDNDKFPPERISIEQDIIKKADRIIAECPQDKEDLVHYYNAPTFKLDTIPCGFSSKEFYPIDKPLARKLLQLPPHDFLILQVGRMVPRKGVDNVIKGMANLKRPDIHLLIVGGDFDEKDALSNSEIKRLNALAQELGIGSMISFAGHKNRDLLKFYYSAADVFVTTPWYEPFGMTPLEAMACGTPVIGSKVGGIKYSVIHGATGLLVPPNDPEALAGSIDQLISDKQLLAQMSRNSLKRVNQEFSWAHIARQADRLYQNVILSSRHTSVIHPNQRSKTQAA
jgi:D-inositol-3-phosphate glycosyltransferase